MRRIEDNLQRLCAQYLDLTGWLWWHTPNGGKRGAIEGAVGCARSVDRLRSSML